MKLGKNMRSMLMDIARGVQPSVAGMTKAQIRSAGNTLRSLLRQDLLVVVRPFQYELSEKARREIKDNP